MTTTNDLFTPGYWDRAHEVAAALRAEGPAYRARLSNGQRVWVVADYSEARAALADPRLSKDSDRLNEVQKKFLVETGQGEELSMMFGKHMLFQDAEAQRRLHKLVSTAFTPGARGEAATSRRAPRRPGADGAAAGRAGRPDRAGCVPGAADGDL